MNIFVISLMAHYITTAPWLGIYGNHDCGRANVFCLRMFSFCVPGRTDKTPWENIKLTAYDCSELFLKPTCEEFDNEPQ